MHVVVKFTQLKAFHPYQPSSHSCSKVGHFSEIRMRNISCCIHQKVRSHWKGNFHTEIGSACHHGAVVLITIISPVSQEMATESLSQ